MATYTLTTSAQEVGRNTTPVVGARLLAWYSNATSTGATVHLKLQAISQGLTYTGTNKDYEMTLGSTATGTVGWSYAPLPADTWVDVREITQTMNFGASAGVSGKVWTYVYGDAWIGVNTVTMPNAPKKPEKPTSTIASTAYNSITVTYGTSSFNTPSTGTVYLYGGTATAPTTQIASKTTTGNSNYTHSGLASNTKYYYRARANNGQWSDYSTENYGYTRPPALSAKSATVAGTTSIKINYTTEADGGALNKAIQYSTDGTNWSNGATVSSSSATSGNFTISGLTPGTAYTINLRVSNASGVTGSGSVTATTYKVPATPTVTAAVATATSNTITYGTTSFNNPASGTVYLYGGTTSSPTTQIASKTTTGNSTYTHSGLASNTIYYYRAKASNAGGDSAYSTVRSVVTKPANPTISVNTYTTTSVTMNYSIAADGGAQPKKLQYSVDGGTTYVDVKTISTGAAESGTFTISGLSPNTNYSITVRQTNTSGGGYASVTQHTAAAPTGGTATVTARTWDTITVLGELSSYGYPSDNASRKIAIGVSNTASSHPYKRENQYTAVTSATTTITNSSIYPGDQPLTLCGCETVYPYLWAWNGIVPQTFYNTTGYVLPPAPLATLALDTLTPSAQDVTAVFAVAGAAADGTNNKSGALVTTQYRYKVGSGSYSAWTTVGTSEAPNTSHTVTLTSLPFDTMVTVEARQSYNGEISEVKTLTFTTSPKTVSLYGSVNGESKEITTMYGSATIQIPSSISGTIRSGATQVSAFDPSTFLSAAISYLDKGKTISYIRVYMVRKGAAVQHGLYITYTDSTNATIFSDGTLQDYATYGITAAEYTGSGGTPINDYIDVTVESSVSSNVSRKILKLYGSVNGQSKLIYQD